MPWLKTTVRVSWMHSSSSVQDFLACQSVDIYIPRTKRTSQINLFYFEQITQQHWSFGLNQFVFWKIINNIYHKLRLYESIFTRTCSQVNKTKTIKYQRRFWFHTVKHSPVFIPFKKILHFTLKNLFTSLFN